MTKQKPKPPPRLVLSLVIKRYWADKIKEGTKKVEYRDFTDYYKRRFVDRVEQDGDFDIIHFKPTTHIRFCIGYRKDREIFFAEVKDIKIENVTNPETGHYLGQCFCIYLGNIATKL